MTIRYLLDTDTSSYVIGGRHATLDATLRLHDSSTLGISCITRAELRFGITRRPTYHALAAEVQLFLERMPCLAWDDAAADRYGLLRHLLERKGRPIGMDTLLAAHALALGATLVTNNERHFRMVDGLAVENWT